MAENVTAQKDAFGSPMPYEGAFRYRSSSRQAPPGARQTQDDDRPRIENLLEEKKPVWIRNVSTMKIGLGFGRTTKVLDPVPHPIEITAMAPRKLIEESDDLFAHMASGHLELLWPEEAEKYYELNPDAARSIEDRVEGWLEKSGEFKPASSRTAPLSRLTSLIYELDAGACDIRRALEALEQMTGLLENVDYAYLASSKNKTVVAWANEHQSNRKS